MWNTICGEGPLTGLSGVNLATSKLLGTPLQKRDWLALVAVHSDCWLLAVAFYNGARLNKEGRCDPNRCRACAGRAM